MPQVPFPDPLELVEERIRLVRTRRSTCERFSDEYWAADDHLAWLRMVRDEIGRTGHARFEIHAALLTTGVGVPVMAETGGPVGGHADSVGTPEARLAQPAEDPGLVAGPA